MLPATTGTTAAVGGPLSINPTAVAGSSSSARCPAAPSTALRTGSRAATSSTMATASADGSIRSARSTTRGPAAERTSKAVAGTLRKATETGATTSSWTPPGALGATSLIDRRAASAAASSPLSGSAAAAGGAAPGARPSGPPRSVTMQVISAQPVSLPRPSTALLRPTREAPWASRSDRRR